MNQTLIDNVLLALALITAVLFGVFDSRRRTGIVSAVLLLFSPLVVFLNMWANNVAVLVVNYKRYSAGIFVYDFHFYSLLLFGIVFIVVSGMSFYFSRMIVNGDTSYKNSVHWFNGITSLFFLPLFTLNPIALLPVIVSVISSATLMMLKPGDDKVTSNATTGSMELIK